MINKIKYLVIPALMFGAVGLVRATDTDPEPDYVADATSAIQAMVGDAASVIFAGLAVVLGVIAALIGLFFLIKTVKRYVSRGK